MFEKFDGDFIKIFNKFQKKCWRDFLNGESFGKNLWSIKNMEEILG